MTTIVSHANARLSRALVCLLLLTLAGSPGPATTVDAAGPADYIVVLRDDVPPDAVSAVARRAVDTARHLAPSLRFERDTMTGETVFRHALRGFVVRVDAIDRAGIDALAGDPDVAYIAADRRLSLQAQAFQPGMERVRVRGHRLTSIDGVDDTRVDADIAVIDSGVDASHPDLAVHRSLSFVPDDPTGVDRIGHGTHVAGIAAAIDDDNGIHGVAPGARLWALKVADSTGVAELSWVLAALDYVAAHADEIDVVNMSLGGGGAEDDGNCGTTIGDPLHQAICTVVDAGIVVVVSAGNQVPFGADASLISPAAYDEVITVSAVIETDGLGPAAGQGPGTPWGADNSFARTFSNYGWDVDIAAPGVDVLSTWPGGGYEVQSGTSMAAAFVSGAAALWIADNGKPTDRAGVMRVREDLVRLAFPQRGPDQGFRGDKETYAEPLLDVAALDPAEFDAVEPRLTTDKAVYTYGVDDTAVVTAFVRDETGAPLAGIPSNGFSVSVEGEPTEVRFEELGDGRYSLSVGLGELLPGDHDLTALVRNVEGFQRSAGCRIVIHGAEPMTLIHDLAFLWPVMSAGSFFSSNPLHLRLMDERGAPVVVSPETIATTFSGGGPGPTWSMAQPSYLGGIMPGITYGAYEASVDDVHLLPFGQYVADVSVDRDGLSDAASASFEIADYAPSLEAELTTSPATCDFTQSIAPPPLDLRVDVRSEWMTGVGGLLYTVADPFAVELDGHVIGGQSFAEDPQRPGSYVAHDVDLSRLADGEHRLVVRVTDSRGLTADSNPATIEVLRDGPPCAAPLAAIGDADGDGDGIVDQCDNCPGVANRSQRSSGSTDDAEAGLGDACRSIARVRVSSDVLDAPDFMTIRDALDGASDASAEIRIEILPGTGAYVEHVVIDRDRPVRIVGLDRGDGLPVIEDDGTGQAIVELRSSGDDGIAIGRLRLRGQGVSSGRGGILSDGVTSTRLTELHFEQLGYGLHLRTGSHVAERIATDGPVGTAVVVEDAAIVLRDAELRDVDSGVRFVGTTGAALVENALMIGTGAGTALRLDENPGATAELRHATVSGFGTAVTASPGGATLAHTILWGNGISVSGVGCSGIAWSDVEGTACGGTNLSLDPLFVDPATGDFHLQAGSPLLDHGPDPRDTTDVPCRDLDDNPRLVDHDGESLAQVDPGAYERRNEGLVPTEVSGIAWSGSSTMEWADVPGAVEYHIYRAPLDSLGDPEFGMCEDGLDAVRADARLVDSSLPAPGAGFFYQVTVEDASGAESTLGFGTCAERSNFEACP